jgi:hypothetical protein
MTLAELQAAIANALKPLEAQIAGLQVWGFMNPNPTPPSLDVYPGDPFQNGGGFGKGDSWAFFTVRARVSTADHEHGQRQLLRLLDPQDIASVEGALWDAGYAVAPEGISGFREYLEEASTNGRLLGCEWRVRASVD